MKHLRAYGGKAEAGNFFRIAAGGNCGQVVEQEGEARVGPIVKFANAGKGEQGKSPFKLSLSYKPSKQRIKPTPTLSKSR
jgi:hypothetical protein